MTTLFGRLLGGFVLLITAPVFVVLSMLIFLSSGTPLFFQQKRVGKDKKIFFIYKFRTMVRNAEAMKKKYHYLNEADGPLFKIKNDPRYTKVGKILSRLGLDELPQLVNIIKGEMAFVGPRPLPVDEAKQIPQKYHKRFLVLPGITSLWVVSGGHNVSFKKWMELDALYIQKKSVVLDISIMIKTVFLFAKMVRKSFLH